MTNNQKMVLITGTSSGIGEAAVRAFAKDGWRVIATMRDPAKGDDLASIKGVDVLPLDVTKPDTIDKAFADVIDKYGQIHAVVNNAGYGVDGVFEAMSDEVIRKQFDTNVLGLMRVTRAAIRHMREQGGGHIVQVASMGGRITLPLYSIYHGTKWAVEGFSESLQYELRPLGIHVKIVEPGAIKTEFYGDSRVIVKPEPGIGYDDILNKVIPVYEDSGPKGESPDKVARTIVRAASHTGRRLRFVVGMPAPILLRLKRWLPETWYFGLVRMSFKL